MAAVQYIYRQSRKQQRLVFSLGPEGLTFIS